MAKKLDRSYFEAQAAKPQTTRPQAASDTNAGSGTKKLDKSFFEVRAEEAKNRPVRETVPAQGTAPAAETTPTAPKRSFGSRLLSGIKSGLLSEGANLANAGGVQADRRGGTEMSGIYREQVSALDQQIAALESNLRDQSLSARQRADAAAALATAKSQRELYEKAAQSGKETAKGLYETADKGYSLAEKYGKESLDGTDGVERAALGAVPTVTQLGTQVAADLLAPGVGTVGRSFSSGGANAAEYRYQAGDDYDSQKAALRMALSVGGVAAGSALSGAVNASGLKLLRQLGKQNYVLPNVALGGASALGYAAGETGLTELSKAMTDENYTPDWNAIGKTGLTAFAFGAITRAIDTARVSVGNKRYMKALNENVQERYNYAKRTIDDPRMTAQQKAQAANSVMDAADKMRYALDELQVVGAQKDVEAMREFLLSIYGDMMQYTNVSSGGISGTGAIVPTTPSTPPSVPVTPKSPVQPTAPVSPTVPSPAAPAVAGRAAVTAATPKATPIVPVPAPQAQNAPETHLASPQERTEVPMGEMTPPNESAAQNAPQAETPPAASTTDAVQRKGRKDVERVAEKMDKAGAFAMKDQYRDGQDAEAYIRGMAKAYDAGKNGTSREELINNLPSGIDGTQARSAYIAGQADAASAQTAKSPLPEAAQSGTMENTKAAPTLTASNLAERLKTHVVAEDGAFRYSVERKGGRFPVYVGSIREISGTDAYATDARAARYVSQNFKTREEAVADLVAVARNSGFIKASGEAQGATGQSPANETPRQAETPAEKPAAPAKKAENPQQQIADEVRSSIERGTAFSSARLFEIADKAYGGTMAQGAYTVKDAYDGMELAVNQHLMHSDLVRQGNGSAANARETLAKLQTLLWKLPTQTKRTAEMESFQQFSTPPNIAYLAAWTANVGAKDIVLEPSAGIGGLALWPKAWGATVYGNELSPRRLAFLNQLGLDGTYNLNAEQINNLLPDEIKPSVVLMNPPFSATAGRTATNKTANAKRHIEQALDRLEEGGRLVAILGNGMENDAPAFRAWWDDLRREYSVRANIRIDGENYKKYGTTFDVQLVVIDKTGPNQTPTITGTYKDLSKIPDLMEDIRNDRTRAEEHPAGVHTAVFGNGDADGSARGKLESKRSGTTPARSGGNDRGNAAGAAALDAGPRRGLQSRGDQGGVEQNAGGQELAGAVGESGSADRPDSIQLERNGSARPERVPDRRGAVKELAENPDSVYSTYSPSKVHIKGAKKHPAKLVESAAMGAVLPPDPTYTPALPARIAKEGILSDAQLENVVYAGQAHSQTLPDGRRRGYFIGDGTGVGKGRQLAGIIMDNYLQGRTKAVWVSEKTGLVNDARRDWSDLGGNKDAILDFSKYKLGQPIADKQGVMFTTYDTLKMAKGGKSRIDDLKAWLGEDFDGVIAFDEAHNMGGFISVKGKRGKTKPAAKAIAGVDLQKAFPNARIVYASATGATDITQYGYLDRLGLWGKGTAFNDVNDFISKISDGGLAAMELVARDMKAMGVYMARSISYDDVKYDTLQHDLTPMQTEIYNTMSRAWQKVLQNMNKALEVTGQSKDGMARGRAVGAFYSTQQRFYNQIITSMAMPSVIEDMRRELAAGRSCVLQLTNTNAAQADRALAKNEAAGGSLDDLDLTPSDTLIQMLEKSFPVELYEEYTDEDGKERSRPVLDKDGKPVLDKKAVQMRDNLIAELQQMKVPDGPLEMLLDAFGADNVAEVTGRTRRVVEKPDENGNMKRVVESRGAASGIADANMFQDGKKRILVFSDAGGTGRSYHADLRAKNQQQRVHYLLQPGWSASKAVQGFGRTHRSNQASAPIFRLVTTNVMGQKRFTSTIARRLDQLGALTKGQRQASGGVFGEKDNLENPIAMDALATFYKSADKEVLKKLGLYDKLFDEWGRINEGSPDLRDISKFLNRILSLEVDEQNATFQQFYDTFERMMDAAIANGTVDMGLENYRADKVEVLDETVIRKDPSGADTRYVQMKVYRKPELIPFSALDTKLRDFKGLVRLEDGGVRAVYEISSKTNEKGEIQRRFSLESPVRGVRSVYVESTLNEKTTKINKSEWAQAWKEETAKAPEYNESTLHLLTGTLLPIWNRLPANNTRVMRVVTSDGGQYLGRVIRPDQIDGVLRSFGANRTMQTYTPEQVSDLILTQGKEVVLRDNRVKLTRRRVSGEWRTEISGTNLWYLQRQYPGIFTERINYEWRTFIPTGEAGQSVLRSLLKDNPVVDVREPAPSGDVDANMVNNVRDAKDEWDAERIKGGEAKEKAKSISEIVEQIRHDFGTNITAGHVRGKRGQYDRATHGIRSKLVNDLPNIAHELGHHLDNTYDLRGSLSSVMRDELTGGLDDAARNSYPKKKWISEGIAEYFRKYLQNREVAAIDYPAFTAYIKNLLPAKDMAQLDQLADEVNAYYSLDADTATSSVRLREEGRPDARTYDEKIKANADALYQAWVDSNHGIKLFDRATGADTYKLATNAAYSDAMAGQIIVGDLTDADGRYVSGGLKTALHGINLNDKEEYRLFGEYLIVRHGPERLAEGMRVFADDRKNSAEFMECRAAVLEQQHPKFKEAADRLYQFERDLRQVWGVDTGLISEQTAKDWDERWKHYVPFNRAVSVERRGVGAKRGFANQKNPIKKAHGSGLDIVHPVDNIINNIVLMVNAGVRNNVMRKITDEARRLGADASLLEPVPTPMKKDLFRAVDLKKELSDTVDQSGMTAEDKMFMLDTIGNISNVLEQFSRGKAYGDVVTVMRGGEPEFWKINDPLLLSSITSLSPKSMNGILDAYAIVSRFMTSNITGMNLLWNIFSNMPRDFQTLLTYSKDKNVAHLVKAIGSAYVNKIKGSGADPLYLEYLAMGGGKTSAYTADRDLTRRARQQLTGEKISLNPLDMIAYISDLIELGPRYATYKLMRERGMTPQEAFYEAMDITVNFRRGGIRAREVNKAVPFFNANVQGLDKHARWITAEDAPAGKRKGAAKRRFLMYLAASAALAAVNYGINNGSDENKKDYQQLSTYTKNSYWVYPIGDGKYLCLPKPRELAVLTSLFEALLERTVGGNEHAFDGFYEYATGNFLPSILSDFANLDAAGAIGSLGLIGVGSYMVANRDFLGRPIESTGMRYLEPRDRYNERTSKLAYWIGQAFDVSPVMVDYFFQNTLGGFWKAQKAIFPVGEENRDWSFGIQGSYIKDNQYSQDLTNWLYDQAEKSSQAKKSDPANMDKAIAAAMDDRMVEFYSSYNKLAKNTPDTVVNRGTRQTVLDAIYEYRKAHDHNITTDAERMAYGVCKEQGGTELLPSCLPVTVKDGDEKTHSLSASQYVEYQFDYNRLYWEYVEDMLSPSQSADERAAVLRAAKTVAKEEATNRILSELRAPKTSHAEKYEGVKAEDVAMFKAFCDLANDDGSLKQEEVINIIKGMNLSGEESYALFKSKYPKSDANNPWRRYR